MVASVQMGLLDSFRAPFLQNGLLSPDKFEALKEEVKVEIYKGNNGRGWEVCFPFTWVWGVRL